MHDTIVFDRVYRVQLSNAIDNSNRCTTDHNNQKSFNVSNLILKCAWRVLQTVRNVPNSNKTNEKDIFYPLVRYARQFEEKKK